MRSEILALLDAGGHVSGEKMARKLSVSRTAIWKQVRSLQELGYGIETAKRGYRLLSRPDIPLPDEVKNGLKTRLIGREVMHHFETASTNVVARDLLKEGPREGTVIIAEVQTGGRGRLGRRWHSNKGGLWFSVILYPPIPPERGMLLTMATSAAVRRAIGERCGINATIKWPNDLLVDGKKVCGILTELDAEMDRINSAVIGIGINVNNELHEEVKGIGTTLKEEMGGEVSRVPLLRSILSNLDDLYGLIGSDEQEKIKNEWFAGSGILGRMIEFTDMKGSFVGRVTNVDDSGCLDVETKPGHRRIVAGDIRYLD